MRADDHVRRDARGQISYERRAQLAATVNRQIGQHVRRLALDQRIEQPFDFPDERRHRPDLSGVSAAQILKIEALDGLDQSASARVAADHHFHERREFSFGSVRPFADRSLLLFQRGEVETRQCQERHALRASDPLLARDLVEMARRARLLERRHGHDALVLAAVVASCARLRNTPSGILLCHFREVLTKMAFVIVDEARALLERILLEFRMIAVEAVELHHVARLALLVGDLVQLELGALMLLVAGRTIEAARRHIVRRESRALSAHRMRRRCFRRDFSQPLCAPLQHVGCCTVRIESRIRHFMTTEACIAIGVPVANDEAVQPAQFATAALGVAGAAILDRAVRARERSRHQELHVVGENEGQTYTNKGSETHHYRETIASGDGARRPLLLRRPGRSGPSRPPHHHQAADEKAYTTTTCSTVSTINA